MRAPPTLQLSLGRSGWWRAALFAIALLAVAVMTAWVVKRSEALSPIALAVWSAALITIVFVTRSSMRTPAVVLRWDGEQWWLAPQSDKAGEQAGQIDVMLDFGAWMLLRFRPDRPARTVATRWLPTQRRGLEAQWHALRCAVYFPGPAPARDAAGSS